MQDKNSVENIVLKKQEVQNNWQGMVGNWTAEHSSTGPRSLTSPAKSDRSRKEQKHSALNSQVWLVQIIWPIGDSSEAKRTKVWSVQEAEPVEDQRRQKSPIGPRSPTGRTRSVQKKSKATFGDFLANCVCTFQLL